MIQGLIEKRKHIWIPIPTAHVKAPLTLHERVGICLLKLSFPSAYEEVLLVASI